MDERDGRVGNAHHHTGPKSQSDLRSPHVTSATQPATRSPGRPALADVAAQPQEPHGSAAGAAAADAGGESIGERVNGVLADVIDPRDPRWRARLRARTDTGGYVISDADLVRAIRVCKPRGQEEAVRELCEALIDRCMPLFHHGAQGLRQRPELMQDAIGGMIEQVLREAQDPNEIFMTQNFIHYVRCVAVDNFTRTLRQEGLSFRRDAQGRPAGRPQHVPRTLVDQIDVSAEEQEDPAAAGRVVADPRDQMSERDGAMEAERILRLLSDPLDQRIMVLRVFEHRQWEEIAQLCGKTERTMRLRFEKARVVLQDALARESSDADAGRGE